MDATNQVDEFSPDSSQERWLSYLALTTVVLAVCATLAGFKEGNFSIDSILSQSQAANQWSYYQSKSIKTYLYEMRLDMLAAELETGVQNQTQAQKEFLEKKIADYKREVDRYGTEKNQIMSDAKKFETNRDMAQRRSSSFGISVIFLQMGILLSSIAALMRKKSLWLAGIAIGAFGIVYFADGFFLFLT